MGMDFVALLSLPAGPDSEAIRALELGSPSEVEDFRRLLALRAYCHFGEDTAVWVDQRCSDWVYLPAQPSLPTTEHSLRLPSGFDLYFGVDAVLAYHPLRWVKFLKDLEFQAAALDAVRALCEALAAVECAITCDYQPIYSEFLAGSRYAECLAAMTGAQQEVETLESLYVERESESSLGTAYRPEEDRLRQIVRWPQDRPLPPGWARSSSTVWDSQGYWRFPFAQERARRLDEDTRSALSSIGGAKPEAEPPCSPPPPPYLDPLFPVKRDGYCGYIDLNGAFAIEPRFRNGTAFVAGRAAVWLDGWRTIAASGEFVDESCEELWGGPWIDPPLVDHPVLSPVSRAGDEGRRWGFLDQQTRYLVIPCRFLAVRSFSEGLAAARGEAGWGFVDESGRWRIEPRFSEAEDFCSGFAAVSNGELWGYVNAEGELVVPFRFDSVSRFRPEGVARVSLGRRWGLVRADGSYLWEPRA